MAKGAPRGSLVEFEVARSLFEILDFFVTPQHRQIKTTPDISNRTAFFALIMSAEPTEDGGYHFSFKVAICGDTGVGKTTLLEGEGASSYARTSGDTTVGINFRVKFYEVDGQTYRVQFWDCPGAERYMKLTSRYCAGAAGAIFVFDVNNRATFDHISDWIRQVEKNGPVLKVLVGNKVDDNSRGSGREVTQQEAEAFADKNGLDYFETAALTGLRVNHVFQGKFVFKI